MLFKNITSLKYYIYNTLAQFETLNLGGRYLESKLSFISHIIEKLSIFKCNQSLITKMESKMKLLDQTYTDCIDLKLYPFGVLIKPI